MIAKPLEFAGLAQVRDRFVDLLQERQTEIATHALGAWDGETAEVINSNLAAAQVNLHRIAGTAGSLGFPELGETAAKCETDIIAHLEGPMSEVPICPKSLVVSFGSFLAQCEDVLRQHNPALQNA